MKEDYWKTLKELMRGFVLHPVPFYGQDSEKQEGPKTSH